MWWVGGFGDRGGGLGDRQGKVKGNQHNDQNLGTELSKLCVLKENDYFFKE
jgi:hypothetical protein